MSDSLTMTPLLKIGRVIALSLLLMVLAWVCAGLGWRLVSEETPPSIRGQESEEGTLSTENETVSLFAPLFGVFSSKPQEDPIPYALKGVYFDPNGHSFALIASQDKMALYSPNALLPGGERLQTIQTDRIVLVGNDSRPTVLTLLPLQADLRTPVTGSRPSFQESPSSQERGSFQGASFQETPSRESASRPAIHRLSPIPKALINNREFLEASRQSVRFSRVRTQDGQIGHKIQWLKPGEFSQTLGLRSGDVILSVNDVQVGRDDAFLKLARSIPSSRAISMDIRRDDTPLTLLLPFE